jgi:predicted transport protein
MNQLAGRTSGEDIIAAQYKGLKAPLRPIYESLLSEIRRFGGDVEVVPKRYYVSVRRHKQFAIIRPSTPVRVDVGISLKAAASNRRLEAARGFSAAVSHRVRVSSVHEIDRELIGWLRQAYEAA